MAKSKVVTGKGAVLNTGRLFRVFVSSTFKDMEKERNELQNNTFKRLKDLCRKYGSRFQAVDLRWGISEKAGEEQLTMKMCLEEIEHCKKVTPKPNFFILLGDRYGWRPLPAEIEVETFARICFSLAQTHGDISGVEKLEHWYMRDDNAVPPQFVLKPRHEDNTLWTNTERKLSALIRKAVEKGNFNEEEKVKLTGSATEQEIMLGTNTFNKQSDLFESVFCFFRSISTPINKLRASDYFDMDEDTIDIDAQTRLLHLKQKLKDTIPDNVYEYNASLNADGSVTEEHIQLLCDDVYNCLSKVIFEQINEFQQFDEIDSEWSSHEEFRKERISAFVGRVEELMRIELHIVSSSIKPFAIVGDSGIGKSALIAQVVEQTHAKEQFSNMIIISRFIGATPDSSNLRLLLRKLCQEIARHYGDNESNIPDDFEELKKFFYKKLKRASQTKPLTVFVDALDQLSGIDNFTKYSWIPKELPPFVRLIFSALPELGNDMLKHLELDDNVLELSTMTPNEGIEVLNKLLNGVGRRLEQNVRYYFTRCSYPLYFKLVFEKARHLRSFDRNFSFGLDTHTVIKDLFKELSDEKNHGKQLVQYCLTSISAAKNGLSEDELLDLLNVEMKKESQIKKDFINRFPDSPSTDSSFPPIVWSLLYNDLKSYLSIRNGDGARLMSFFHRTFAETVEDLYLKSSEEKRKRHERLANFFHRQELYFDKAKKHSNLRKLSELPYQQAEAKLWREAKDTLMDFAFINAKTCAMGPYALLEDFKRLRLRQSEGRTGSGKEVTNVVNKVEDAIGLSAHDLSSDPLQLAGHLRGRLLGSREPEINKLLNQARPSGTTLWLRPITASLHGVGGSLIRTLGGHGGAVWDIDVSSSGKFAVSASYDRTVVLWNLEDRVEVYRKNLPAMAYSVAITSDEKFFVCAAEYTLSIFDLMEGECTEQREFNKEWGLIPDVAWRTDYQIIFGTEFGGLHEWDLVTNELHQWGEQTLDYFRSMALMKNRNCLIAGSNDNPPFDSRVIVYDLEMKTTLRTWEIEQSGVNKLVVTPDEQKVFTAERNGKVRKWDIETGECEQAFDGSTHFSEKSGVIHSVNGISLTSDGQYLLSTWGSSIIVWDLESGKPITKLEGHHTTVQTLSVLSDSHRFLSGSQDYTVKLWDIDRNKKSASTRAHDSAVNSLALTPDGKSIVSASDDRTLKLWDIDTGELIRTFEGHKSEVWSVAVTSDGTRIISITNGHHVIVWNLNHGEKLKGLSLHPPKPSWNWKEHIHLINGGHKFFYGGALFDSNTGEELWNLAGHIHEVVAVFPGDI